MNDEKSQVNLPSESDFPLNLRYADVIPPVLEFEIVKKMGQRYRRRYRAAIGTSVTASMAAATLFACTIASTNSSSTAAPGGTQPTASALPTAQYPPLNGVTMLGTVSSGSREGWAEVAWVSRNGVLCYGVADLRRNATGVSINCGTTPVELTGADTTPTVYTPIFTADVPDPNSILAFGFVRGGISSVSLTTTFGTSATAKTVVKLDGTEIRGYALMVPTAGSKAIDSSNIKTVVGMDAAGATVAHVP